MTDNGQALSRDGERRRLEAARLESDQRRRDRVAAAKAFCRGFAGDHLDVCAMAKILLDWENPGGGVTREMVKARVRATYPWIGAGS